MGLYHPDQIKATVHELSFFYGWAEHRGGLSDAEKSAYFKAHNAFNRIVDQLEEEFLKGGLSAREALLKAIGYD